MSPIRASIVVPLLAGLTASCLTASAPAGFKRLTIRNDTGSFANELRVEFDSRVEQVRFLTQAEGGQDATGVLGDGGLSANFAPRTIGLVPPTESGRAFLDFEVAPGTHSGLSRERPSTWGSNSEELGPITTIGASPTLAFEQDGSGAFLASATFYNPEEFSLIYDAIELYKNNIITTYNINEFFIPTGQPVPGLPSSVTLDPGESLTLMFGAVDPSLSQLAMARVAASSTPDDFFRVAATGGAVVPEPHTATLSGLGILVLLALGRRCRGASRHRPDGPRPATRLRPCAGSRA